MALPRSAELLFHASCDVAEPVRVVVGCRELSVCVWARRERGCTSHPTVPTHRPSPLPPTPQVRLRVDRLAATPPASWRDAASSLAAAWAGGPAALRVAASLVDSRGAPLSPGPPLETGPSPADTAQPVWGDTLTWPVAVRDLPPDAAVAVRVEAVTAAAADEECSPRPASDDALAATLVATGTQPLFSKRGRLKDGPRTLVLRVVGGDAPPPPPLHSSSRALALRARRLARGDLGACEWLDPLAAAAAGRAAAAEEEARALPCNRAALTLSVVLPSFSGAPILYAAPPADTGTRAGGGGGGGGSAAGGAAAAAPATTTPLLRPLPDPETGLDSPAELAAALVARGGRSRSDGGGRGGGDRDTDGDDGDRAARPDAREAAAVARVLASPPDAPLAPADRGLLWRLRWALAPDPRALPHVLRAGAGRAGVADLVAALPPLIDPVVAPSDRARASRAAVPAALALLGPELAHVPAARVRAAAAVAAAPTADLLTYALFLVQALRFDRGGAGGGALAPDAADSPLAAALTRRALACPRLALALHWHLVAELDDPSFGPRAASVHARLLTELRAAAGPRRPFASTFPPPAAVALAAITAQVDFVHRLRRLADGLDGVRTAVAKAERLRGALAAPGGPLLPTEAAVVTVGTADSGESQLPAAPPPPSLHPPPPTPGVAVPSPVDAAVTLVRVAPPRCSVFRSALAPLLLSFDAVPSGLDDVEVEGGGGGDAGGSVAARAAPHPPSPPPIATRHDVIYKRGDDLRQDALVLALASAADAALRSVGLDLRLTLYTVLPTSPADGLIQRVPGAIALADALREHKSVHRYFASCSGADPRGPLGLKPAILDALTRSLAGYAALTYVLGVGDRHADNVLLCPDGRALHIDFGFILGRDPRPWAPPARVPRELVDALGGAGSPHFARFTSLACEAFTVLRSAGPRLAACLHLASRCAAPDVARAPARAVLFVLDRLRLDVGDVEAADGLAAALRDGAAALVPALFDKTHQWAQNWR